MSAWITPQQAAAAIEKGDGRGVRVAVLDSGVEIAHPNFAGLALWEDIAVDPRDAGQFLQGNGIDIYGHGTAVAGIIWSLAPRAEIGSYRVLGPRLGARTMQVGLAARRAIAKGYSILNCSFGCAIAGHMALYTEWVNSAMLANVHVVAACGGLDVPEWPAWLSSVLGVDAALEYGGDGAIFHHPGRMVEFSLAGSYRVPWNDGDYRFMTGSSFAAAHMTGLIARLLSVHPHIDPLVLKALFRRIAQTHSEE